MLQKFKNSHNDVMLHLTLYQIGMMLFATIRKHERDPSRWQVFRVNSDKR